MLIAEDTTNKVTSSLAFTLTPDQAKAIRADMLSIGTASEIPRDFRQHPQTLERYAKTLIHHLKTEKTDTTDLLTVLKGATWNEKARDRKALIQRQQQERPDMMAKYSDDPIEAALLRAEHYKRINELSSTERPSIPGHTGGRLHPDTVLDAIVEFGRGQLDSNFDISEPSETRWVGKRYEGTHAGQASSVDVLEATSIGVDEQCSLCVSIPARQTRSTTGLPQTPSSCPRYDRSHLILSLTKGKGAKSDHSSYAVPLSDSQWNHLQPELEKLGLSSGSPASFSKHPCASTAFAQALTEGSGIRDEYGKLVEWKPEGISWAGEEDFSELYA